MPHLADQLPTLLPRILVWANAQAEHIARQGIALNAAGLTLASRVGVAQPERIRILTVPTVPDDPELRQIAIEQNLIGPSTARLTLGYGIFIVEGCVTLVFRARLPALADPGAQLIRRIDDSGSTGFSLRDSRIPAELAQ